MDCGVAVSEGLERLDYLAGLGPGWGEEGDENAVDPGVVDCLRDLLANGLDDVRIYPTVEGGISLEWNRPEGFYALELEPGSGRRVGELR